MDNKKIPKNYVCALCDFECSKLSNFNKHLSTRKHEIRQNDNKKEPKNALYKCESCFKEYKFFSGLSRHKKTCKLVKMEEDKKITEYDISGDNIDNMMNMLTKDMVIQLIKENSEIKNLLCKQSEKIEEQHQQITKMLPKINSITNNTINTANINQKFNINIFLNEKCKDAINMSDFIKSIEISLEQMDLTKTKGLSEGLSSVLIENMNKLSLYERPMHCTDIKRETLYIKENDFWEKDKDKTKIKNAIKITSNKQFKTLQKWTKDNPDFKENDLKQEYFARAISAIAKDTGNIDEKIIKKICSNIYLKDIQE